MIEEEKTVTDFVVEEVYGNLKKEYGDLPKKKSTAIKPKMKNAQIQLEQMIERNKTKEQLYAETVTKLHMERRSKAWKSIRPTLHGGRYAYKDDGMGGRFNILEDRI